MLQNPKYHDPSTHLVLILLPLVCDDAHVDVPHSTELTAVVEMLVLQTDKVPNSTPAEENEGEYT